MRTQRANALYPFPVGLSLKLSGVPSPRPEPAHIAAQADRLLPTITGALVIYSSAVLHRYFSCSAVGISLNCTVIMLYHLSPADIVPGLLLLFQSTPVAKSVATPVAKSIPLNPSYQKNCPIKLTVERYSRKFNQGNSRKSRSFGDFHAYT